MEIHNLLSIQVVITSFAEVFADLKNRGYKKKFRRASTCLCCIELYLWITPEQFSVDECYYFEEISSPDGDRLLYAISTSNGVKGVLLDACGVYADNMSLEMNQKLRIIKGPIDVHETEITHRYNREVVNKSPINGGMRLKIRQGEPGH